MSDTHFEENPSNERVAELFSKNHGLLAIGRHHCTHPNCTGDMDLVIFKPLTREIGGDICAYTRLQIDDALRICEAMLRTIREIITEPDE